MAKEEEKKKLTAKEKREAFRKEIAKVAKTGVKIGAINSFDYKKKGARWFTGVLPMDILVGGGYRAAGLVEITGSNDVGKTSILLETIQNISNIYKNVYPTILGIDGEHNFAEDVYERFRDLDLDNIATAEPDSMEQMFETILSLKPDICFIDSIPAITSILQQKQDLETAEMALGARQASKGWGRTYTVRGDGTLIIAINQESSTMDKYKPKTPKGGDTLKYAKTYAIKLSKSEAKAEWIGTNKEDTQVTFGGDKNSTEVAETPFATKVKLTYDKMKFGGNTKDSRYIYLKARANTNHEAYSVFSNRPGAFVEITTLLSMAVSKETIVEKKGVASYTIYSPFTAEPIVSATGRTAIQMEIIKDYKVIFELVCALYMEFLPKAIVFTNYRSILEVARFKAQHYVKYYNDVMDLSREDADKLVDKLENMGLEYMKKYPLDYIFDEITYTELLKQYGKYSFIWDRDMTDEERNKLELDTTKEIKALEKKIADKKKAAKKEIKEDTKSENLEEVI